MDVYKKDLETQAVQCLTKRKGYDAEATISPDGKTIIFTSDREGDLELYTMSLDGTNVRRLTYTPGYDGGAFFSVNKKKKKTKFAHLTFFESLFIWEEQRQNDRLARKSPNRRGVNWLPQLT